MSFRSLMAAVVALAVLVGIGASSVLASGSQTQVTTVRVSALDTLKFTLTTKRAKAGTVKFIVTNKGALKHDFWIAGKKTRLLGKNQSQTITATIKKGNNPYKCTVPGHAAAGMKGVFVGT
jgi:plastocyanin